MNPYPTTKLYNMETNLARLLAQPNPNESTVMGAVRDWRTNYIASLVTKMALAIGMPDIDKRTRQRRYVNSRRFIYWTVYNACNVTQEQLGAQFGNNHATIHHHCDKHRDLYRFDMAYRHEYDVFLSKVQHLLNDEQYNLLINYLSLLKPKVKSAIDECDDIVTIHNGSVTIGRVDKAGRSRTVTLKAGEDGIEAGRSYRLSANMKAVPV